jgi:hypothetical protein
MAGGAKKIIPVFPVDAGNSSSIRKVQRELRIMASVRPKIMPRFVGPNGAQEKREGATIELHPTKGWRRA